MQFSAGAAAPGTATVGSGGDGDVALLRITQIKGLVAVLQAIKSGSKQVGGERGRLSPGTPTLARFGSSQVRRPPQLTP